MQKFLYRLGVVFLSVIGICLVQDQRESILDPKASFSNLIIGDSHAQALSFSSFSNLGSGGEPFFLSACKARRFTEHISKTPEILILTVGPQNFSRLPESRINNDFENWRTDKSHFMSSLISIEHAAFYLPSECWIPFLIKSIAAPKAIQLSHSTKSENDWTDNAQSRTKRHQVQKKDWFLSESHQTSSLNDLQQVCKEWGAKLILLETPRHSSYDELIETSSLAEYHNYLDEFALKHENTLLLRDTLFRTTIEWFRDSDHVNSRGSREVESLILNHIKLE